jgi:hypothetical protein
MPSRKQFGLWEDLNLLRVFPLETISSIAGSREKGEIIPGKPVFL